jgi:hypothetical protein
MLSVFYYHIPFSKPATGSFISDSTQEMRFNLLMRADFYKVFPLLYLAVPFSFIANNQLPSPLQMLPFNKTYSNYIGLNTKS